MSSQPHLSNCSFFPAVEINDVKSERHLFTPQPWDPWADLNFATDRKAAILGCFGSTIRLLENVSKRAELPAAVLALEDDVIVSERALAALHEFIFSNRFDHPWDVVRFYVHDLDRYRKSRKSVMEYFADRQLVKEYHSDALGHSVYCFVSKYGDWGTQAVLYKGESVSKVERYLKTAKLADLDKMIARSANAPTDALRSLICVTPASEMPIFEHNTWNFDTDIPKTFVLSAPSDSVQSPVDRRPWNVTDDLEVKFPLH